MPTRKSSSRSTRTAGRKAQSSRAPRGAGLRSMHDLFKHHLKDLRSVEEQLVRALPKLVKAAESPELREAIEAHLDETRGQLERVEQLFKSLQESPGRHTCEAMKGIISEGDESASHAEEGPLRDSAIIAGAQRAEHYEIAAYGTAAALADQLGLTDAAQVLRESLAEEKAADQKLTQLAESSINPSAARAEPTTPIPRTGSAPRKGEPWAGSTPTAAGGGPADL